MPSSTLRRSVAPVGVLALTAGLALIGAPAHAGTVNFQTACQATPSTSLAGPQHQVVAASASVTAPATVAPGETFTYRIQPGPGSYPDSQSGGTTAGLSRLKFDFEIPANSTFVNAVVAAGTGANLGGVAPNVLRVSTSGTVDAAGPILRLSGDNQTIGNGPSSSGNSEGGITAPKLKKNLDGTSNSGGNSVFQLPAVDVTVVAGAAGTITPKLRVSGNAAGYNSDENYSTSLAKASAPFVGTVWAPTRCVPKDSSGGALNAGGGPLATVNVVAAAVATATTVTAPATATTGTAIDLSAAVAPAPSGGTVQFKDGDTNIGAPVNLAGGNATRSHTFATAGAHSITAVYSGTTGFTGSTSAVATVDVQGPAPVDVATATTLTIPATATTGSAVGLSATIAPAPTGGTVQFKADNTPIGAPVEVVGGVATLAHTFTTTGHRNISASYSGSAGFLASNSASQTIDVNAPAPTDTATVTKVTALSTATVNKPIDLSATVTPSPAGGTVQFMDGTSAIGGPVTVVNGAAILSHTFTSAGEHSITAVYSGAPGFVASTSSPFAVTASAAGTPGGSGSAGSPFGS
ncbi:Ig-like domain-containing protein [Rhodococcus sp. UNC363MFTsu5.1]|uniref:Ig-like domain-containing protein n=1 Tax=Rhodococcus sp. UNC363MFTsu5.1 TaxID=1449069 RepID=UPI0004877878|nr:Ig-like domain-containing protein [Rhodococcus sp. UNC363MFTsu5.1]